MIDADTIDGIDDCDGERALVLARDKTTGRVGWQWVSLRALHEAGRGDIVAMLLGGDDGEAE